MAGPIAGLAVLGQAAGAVQNFVNEIRRAPDAVRQFTDALNPASGQRLDYAFRSLYATLGGGLEPVITTATKVVEQFADSISGGMTRLRGPIEKLGSLFLGTLQPVFATVGTIFDGLADAAQTLMPLMEALAPVFEAMMAFGRVLTTIGVEALLAALKGLMGQIDGVKAVTATLTENFYSLAEGAILAAHHLFKLAGQGQLMLGVLQRLAQGPAQGGRLAPAATNVAIGDLQSVINQRTLAAARGSGQDAQTQTADNTARIREIAERLLAMMENNPGGFDQRARQLVNDVGWGFAERGTAGMIGPRSHAAIAALGPALQALLRSLRQDERNQP